MKPLKDNFSDQAQLYRKYRPDYPPALYELIFEHCKNFNLAWDCATGNGQVARVLSKYFKSVIATDISIKQLNHAPNLNNVEFRESRAELSGLDDHSIDLVTVGQAVHWFSFNEFYKEVERVLKTNGTIAVWTYGTFRVSDKIDSLIDNFYRNIVGPYWDPEREYIDLEYKTIPFPFEEIQIEQNLHIEKEWSINDLEGYLNTWSSVAHFKRANSFNPVDDLIYELSAQWQAVRAIRFPLYMRLGYKT